MSVLPKGAGAVRCIDCRAEARADGKGTPIVLIHHPNCPSRLPLVSDIENDSTLTTSGGRESEHPEGQTSTRSDA